LCYVLIQCALILLQDVNPGTPANPSGGGGGATVRASNQGEKKESWWSKC
jgi:hypothetical protein